MRSGKQATGLILGGGNVAHRGAPRRTRSVATI